VHKVTVYALPCLIGVGSGQFAYATDAGPAGAVAIGLVASVVSFMLLRFAYSSVASPTARGVLAFAFVTPSVLVGFFIVYGISREIVPSEFWRGGVSAFAAGLAGLLAFSRLRQTDLDRE
jgi:hypothetical protein